MTSVGNTAGLCQRCHHLEDGHDGISCEAVGCSEPPEADTDHPPGFDAVGALAREHARPVLLRWHTPIRRPLITQAPPAMGPGTSTLAQINRRRAELEAAKRACEIPLIQPPIPLVYISTHDAA